jgi:YlmC/YmxH family sporulation protein
MRLAELDGKEIVNLRDGERLGVFDARDIAIDTDKGVVEGLLVPARGRLAPNWGSRMALVPWRSVKTVGRDIIIVELGEAK